VQHAVTYACDPTTGNLTRFWSYGIAAAQATPPATSNSALLASSITQCDFTYSDSGARTGVVRLALRVERNGESVRLFQQVHVNNAP
jgi:MSHA biogenesis protein MshO